MVKPASEIQIAGMFDRIAGRYDFMNRLLSARQDQRWRKHMIAHVPYRPGGRFLDVATGTGDVVMAAQKARPEYEDFHGVDISNEMMNVGRLKCEKNGVAGDIRFSEMSAESLQIPSNSIDCLTISFGLRNVIDKKKALKEFHRVLNTGGQLLILEFFTPKSGPLSWLFQFYFSFILPQIGRLFSDKSAYSYLPKSVGSFYSINELRKIIYDSGYCIDVQKDFLFGATRLIKARKI
jgi:demethylmenaquinone methyltransferase/2-methoxy-6-polyprenyl-1,4-benzoquinol methylase